MVPLKVSVTAMASQPVRSPALWLSVMTAMSQGMLWGHGRLV
jgi:hypothetical protein